MTVIRAILTGLLGLTMILAASGCQGRLQTGQPLKLEVAANDDVAEYLSNGPSDATLVTLALTRLEDGFYKSVNPQTPMAGESNQLRAYLAKHGVAHATLPREIATGNEAGDSRKLNDVLAYAETHYASALGPHADDDLTEAALSGILKSVKDPYTIYLPPRENRSLTESLNGGDFGGIGVYIVTDRDGNIVVLPIEGMPASRSGMKPGEVVDTANGIPLRGIGIDRTMQLIRGDAGTIVHLAAHVVPLAGLHGTKKGSEQYYAIVRQIIHVPTVYAKMEGHYDYIRLSEFGETSAAEVRTALLNGKKKGAKGYIFDLRDNGGGFVDAAVKISSYFIPEGTIVSTISRGGWRTSEQANGDAIGGLQPLVILVNGYTASASEITSGALQDYHLATLIGMKTYGKGVVQSIYPLPNDGALKITTARYVTPLGRDIQHKGIEPDIVVNQNPDPALIDTPADKQLAAAKARLLQLNR